MNVLPIDLTSIIAVFMGMLVVLIPVAGLTARLALKPIVEAIARYREGEAGNRELQLLRQHVELLEQQLQGMSASLQRLSDEREFHRQLEAPPR